MERLPQLGRQIFLTDFEAGEEFVARMNSKDYTGSFLTLVREGTSCLSVARVFLIPLFGSWRWLSRARVWL